MNEEKKCPMEEKYNIKIVKKGFFVWILTNIIKATAMCIFKGKMFINTKKWLKMNDISKEGTILHEKTHSNQIVRYCLLNFWIKYAFSKKYRWLFEREAYAHQIRFYISEDFNIDPKHYAKICSSMTYLKMIKYDEALSFFENVIKDMNRIINRRRDK